VSRRGGEGLRRGDKGTRHERRWKEYWQGIGTVQGKEES
jgi:hypothetical protein